MTLGCQAEGERDLGRFGLNDPSCGIAYETEPFGFVCTRFGVRVAKYPIPRVLKGNENIFLFRSDRSEFKQARGGSYRYVFKGYGHGGLCLTGVGQTRPITSNETKGVRECVSVHPTASGEFRFRSF